MNIKKKFESIDQSQLSDSQKGILSKIKEATKNFTITDEKSIEKVDGALDNIIAKLEKTNPQAIKGEVKEVEPKKEEPKKATKSRTKTPKEPKKEVGGKRTIFSIAKEIRKADENWEDAKKRAKKIMEDEKKDTTKKMKTETDKLLDFIKRRKELDGLSGTSVKKDSKIEALPKGRRVSKKGWKNQYGESEGGRVYYENRDNRTDRLAPSFADKIYLAEGGYADKGVYVETLDEEIDLSDDAKVRARKTQQGGNKSYGELREMHGASPEALAFANGGYVVIAKSEKGGGFVMSKPTSKLKAEKLKSLLPKIDGESNEVMTLNKASKLSGLVGKEYLKYADGGAIIGTPETPLARGLDIDYTGLVGETGGMSAGELFADGGNVIDAFQMRTVRGVDNKPTEVLTNEQKVEFAEGGGIPNNYDGRTPEDIWNNLTTKQKLHFVHDHFQYGSNELKESLKQTGYKWKYLSNPLKDEFEFHVREGQYAYGGRTRDRKFKNYSQKHEVRYSKNKPHRRGYGYEEGGFMADVYNGGGETRKMQLGEPVIYKGETWEVTQKDGVVGLTSMRQGAWGSDFPFVPISKIDARREVKDFYGNEVRIPYLVEDFEEGGFMTDPNFGDFQSGVYAKGGSIKNEDIKVGEEFWLDNGDVIEIVRLFKENIDEDWVEYKRNGDKKENSVKELRLFINRLNGKKQKSFRERRNEYLEKLGSKEADVWDKIGAESGSQIRNSDKMLKAYAEGVEEMLQKEGVGKGSFDQEDYDFYTDENWHLFNEFLVWNGYYEPEMTKTEKEWREKHYADPKKRNYVSNPSVISVSGSSKSKSKSGKYIVKADIKEVKVKTDAGYEYTFKGSDVLNGVNVLEKGSLLKNNATYVAKRNIIHVELKNGEKVKPANGYWIKKDAKGELFKPEQKNKSIFFEEDGLGVKYVKNGKFDKAKFKKDMEERLKSKRAESVIKIWSRELGMNPSKYIDGEIIEDINFVNDSTKKASDLFENKFEGGGKTTFKEKATAIAKNFEGKKVEPKYQKEYGKTYDKAEAKEVGNKIAGSQKAKYDAKMSGGGSVVNLDGRYIHITYEGQPLEWGETQKIVSHKYSDSKFDKKTLTLNFKDGSNLVLEKQINDFEKGKEVMVKSGDEYVAIELLKDKTKATKMSGGGKTKRGGAMQLAKQIRKDGESWQSALKRANEQMRNK